jgi:uncharacterized protein (TIGR00369 family)
VDDATPAGYPPAQHLLRDLRLEVEHRPDGTSHAWMPADPALLDDGGTVRAGALATLVDVVGGGLAAHAARPDWIATADLTLHLVPGPPGDAVEARGRVLRRGRTTVVLEVGLAGAGGASLGLATMTFSVLARRDSNPVLETPADDAVRMSLSVDGSGFERPFVEALGVEAGDAPGTLVLVPSPYVRNSFGAVQGGVMATLVETSARDALRHACAAPVSSVDLQLTYVALGRTGPIRATAAVLAATPSFGTARVELLDEGEGRLTTLGRVVAAVGAGASR